MSHLDDLISRAKTARTIREAIEHDVETFALAAYRAKSQKRLIDAIGVDIFMALQPWELMTTHRESGYTFRITIDNEVWVVSEASLRVYAVAPNGDKKEIKGNGDTLLLFIDDYQQKRGTHDRTDCL